MGLIPAIRTQPPQGDGVQPTSGPVDLRASSRLPQGPAAPVSLPVAAPLLLDAVPQPAAKPPMTEGQFLAARDAAEVTSEAKTEAARAAYIKASIAAGISPLPLP